MDNQQHTPGPWEISDHRLKTPIGAGPKHIAMVAYFDCGAGDPRSISPSEHNANARLIAAAPELLEALEEALRKMGEDEEQIEGEWGHSRTLQQMEAEGDLSEAIVKARAAIAKAKGGAQ